LYLEIDGNIYGGEKLSDKHPAGAAIIGGVVGALVAGGIVWLFIRPRVESLEKRVSKLESLEFRVQEFEATYHSDVKRIDCEYQFLWSKIKDLKKTTSQIPEMRERLEFLLSRLETVTDSKLREKGYRLSHVV